MDANEYDNEPIRWAPLEETKSVKETRKEIARWLVGECTTHAGKKRLRCDKCISNLIVFLDDGEMPTAKPREAKPIPGPIDEMPEED